jgi:hypothetical protein
MMKSRVRSCDEKNRDHGTHEDINWMLRELGLTEILFPPPSYRAPRLPPTDRDEADSEDEGQEWTAPQPRFDLPPSPPLPPGPFSAAEVDRKIERLLKEVEQETRTIEQAEDEGCTLLEVTDEVTEGLLDDEAFTLLVPFLVMVWEVFVPRGTRGPQLEPERLVAGIQREIKGIFEALKAKSESAFERRFFSGSQPALTGTLCGLVLGALQQLPKKERPNENAEVLMLAVLRAAIEEMDTACRAG